MNKPVFRNRALFQLLPFREWIRENLPYGKQGFVAEDLDLVVRVYSNRFGTDAIGKFMLIELKYKKKWIGHAQQRTFKLIHDVLRRGDPYYKRYLGYFVIQYDNEDWDLANFWINRQRVTKNELIEFLLFNNHNIMSLFD